VTFIIRQAGIGSKSTLNPVSTPTPFAWFPDANRPLVWGRLVVQGEPGPPPARDACPWFPLVVDTGYDSNLALTLEVYERVGAAHITPRVEGSMKLGDRGAMFKLAVNLWLAPHNSHTMEILRREAHADAARLSPSHKLELSGGAHILVPSRVARKSPSVLINDARARAKDQLNSKKPDNDRNTSVPLDARPKAPLLGMKALLDNGLSLLLNARRNGSSDFSLATGCWCPWMPWP
jgi:hypothetical protein